MKKCQFCAEEIQDEAKKCRFCGSDLSAKQEADVPYYELPKILPKKILISGEKIYLELRPIAFDWYWFPGLLLVISFFWHPLFFFSIPVTVIVDYSYRGRVYALTNKRVIMTTVEFLAKRVKDCPLGKIQNVDLKVPFASLNTGDISFDTAGTPFKEIVWKTIKNPNDVHQKISSIIHK